MILTGRTPRLRADNLLQGLIAETDDGGSVEEAAAQFLQKVELIVSIHDNVLTNCGAGTNATEKELCH